MERKIAIVQNTPIEGPGTILDVIKQLEYKYKIYDLDNGDPFPSPDQYDVLVVMGGPDSANDETPKMLAEIAGIQACLAESKPYLGICLGMQALIKASGGNVIKNQVKEIGPTSPDGHPYVVEITTNGRDDPLFIGVEENFVIFHLHGETVELSEEDGAHLLATGKYCTVQIVKVGTNAYGIQGHVEIKPDMFELWRKKDPDMHRLPKEKTRAAFNEYKDEYLKTAQKVFTNFFTLN